MKITHQCVAALTWTLKDTLGEPLDTLDEPVEFLIGGEDLLAKIEEHLMGLEAGSEVQCQIEPEDAFGDFKEQLLFLEPRHLFPAELEEGMAFEGLPPGGNPAAPAGLLYFVTEIYPEHVVLDANHPLAGIALRLTLNVHGVRQATLDEVGKGSLGVSFFKMSNSAPDADSVHSQRIDQDHANHQKLH